MPVTLLAPLLLAAAAQPAVSTAGAGCTRLLTGRWAGRGTVSAFGPAMQVEAEATYRANGAFVSTSRFRGRDGQVQATTMDGRWTARAGRGRNTCSISMSSETANSSSSSTSEVQIVDRDTYRSMGVDMRRMR